MWIEICILVTVWGSVSPADGYPECQADLNKIGEGKETWAFKILDSSTKLPSGILTGHLVDYGNYDECFSAGGNIQTQYCMASIFPPQNVMNEITGNDSSLIPGGLAFRWSYCMPASCPAVVLQTILNDSLQEFGLNVSVKESDCSRKSSKSISTGDYFGISIWTTFVALAVFSTIYDVLADRTGGRKNKWLSSFSIYTNGKNLLKTEVSQETMLPLHGLRFLSICWVVLGHRYFFTASSSLLNLVDFVEEMKKLRSQFFIQGVLAVDTFFLLSGLLNCYHLLKVLDKLQRLPIAKYYIHRYIRLTPVLGAIVLMYATWYPLIGDGPVWEQTTSVWKQLCVDNWLPTLLYINNYYNPVTQCAGQSWYLAVDMQLYWLSPLIIIPLWKRPKLGKLLLGMLLLASTISQFLIAFIYKFRMSFSFGVRELSLKRMKYGKKERVEEKVKAKNEEILDKSPVTYKDSEELERVTKLIYVPTHTRATPYIIGVMVGHYLYNLKKNKLRLVLSKGLLCLCWLLSTLIALSVVFGNYQFSRPLADHPYNRWESSLYIAFHRIGWSAAVGWIIIACLNKQGGIINSILSYKAFIPLSRLTYCIFLCHMAIQQYNFGTARTSDYFQYFNQVHRYFGDLVFSVMAAAALSLVFESPILVLEKLTGGKPQERDLKSEVNNGFQDDSAATSKTHEI